METAVLGGGCCCSLSYDPAVISYSEILDIFWAIHNPTTPNRQGNDVGASTDQSFSIIQMNSANRPKLTHLREHFQARLKPEFR